MRAPLFAALVAAHLASVAQAAPIVYRTNLTGAAENPPIVSTGTGFAIVTIDTVAHTLRVQASFADLVGVTTVAHVHCCIDPPGNVGVATAVPSFPLFPAGVQSGSYDRTFDTTDLSTFRPGFVTANGGTAAGAEAALAAGLAAGQAYFNLHSNFAPGGEIRGFLAAVPEPMSLALLGCGVAGLLVVRRRPAA